MVSKDHLTKQNNELGYNAIKIQQHKERIRCVAVLLFSFKIEIIIYLKYTYNEKREYSKYNINHF